MACINQCVMGTRVLVRIISKTMNPNLADYFESGRAESNKLSFIINLGVSFGQEVRLIYYKLS